jgi:phosphoglycerate dehydrogenase-like enzyme
MQVGGEVARRARGLGMVVQAYDPYASEEKARAQGVRLVSFDEALEQGDFFSLHMPLTPGEQRPLSGCTVCCCGCCHMCCLMCV